MLEAESSVLWGFSEIEPNKATLNCLLQYYALFGLLKTRYKIEQQWQSQTAKEKEGYEQILKFL
jgi:hypothetical protein